MIHPLITRSHALPGNANGKCEQRQGFHAEHGNEMNRRKKALMQELLTGNVRVKVGDA